MRKQVVQLLGILSILVFVVSISGCIDDTPENKNYSANGITFQYPGNWSELNKSSYQNEVGETGEIIFALGNNQTHFVMQKRILADDEVLNTLSGWAEETKDDLSSSNAQLLSEKSLNVSGVEAYQLRFMIGNEYYTTTAFIKNETGYVLLYVSVYNDTETVDSILNSFKME